MFTQCSVQTNEDFARAGSTECFVAAMQFGHNQDNGRIGMIGKAQKHRKSNANHQSYQLQPDQID